MHPNDDFKKLWNQKATPLPPDTKELIKKSKGFRRNNMLRLIAINAVAVLTTCFVIFIWYNLESQIITTKIGIVLTIAAVLIFSASYVGVLPFLKEFGYQEDVKNYLNNLLRFKRKQKLLQTTILNVYFVLLSTGILLYMVQFVLKMTLTLGLLSYGIFIGWIIFVWVYLRPKAIKKQMRGIDKLIEKFETFSVQLEVKE